MCDLSAFILAQTEPEVISKAWQTGLSIYEVLAPVVVMILAWVGYKLDRLITSKTENESVRGTLLRLNHSLFNSVKKVNQTMVAKIKQARSSVSPGGVHITETEACELKAAVWQDLKNEYGGLDGLQKALRILGIQDTDGLKSFIDSKIEATVFDVKLAEKAIRDPGEPSS